MRFAALSSFFAGKLDFVPLLNVILLLLLFFLLCSSFFVLQVGEPITLPAAADAQTGSPPSRLILVVSHDPSRPDGDKIFFNDQLTNLEKLSSVLSEAKASFPGDSLIIKIDRSAPSEALVSILQIARQLDLKVTLATSLAPATSQKTAPINPETPAHGITSTAQ